VMMMLVSIHAFHQVVGVNGNLHDVHFASVDVQHQ
jgi:hypothetical protein